MEAMSARFEEACQACALSNCIGTACIPPDVSAAASRPHTWANHRTFPNSRCCVRSAFGRAQARCL
eukprot:1688427-Pleurochrysis_carterae.AAC.2